MVFNCFYISMTELPPFRSENEKEFRDWGARRKWKIKDIKITINLLINKLSCSLCGAPEKSLHGACQLLAFLSGSWFQSKRVFSARAFSFLRQMAIFKILCVLSLLAFPATLLRNRFAIDFNMQTLILFKLATNALHHISFAFFSFVVAGSNSPARRPILMCSSGALSTRMHVADSFKRAPRHGKSESDSMHFQIQFLGSLAESWPKLKHTNSFPADRHVIFKKRFMAALQN